MSWRLVWCASAQEDLREIVAASASWDSAFAHELNGRIQACAEHLAEHPYIHPTGRVCGTREALVHPNYALTYRAGEDMVEIVGVLHTCRQFPPGDPVH